MIAGLSALWYTIFHMVKNEALKQEALDFLRKHIIAVVATTDDANTPQAATVLYHIDDNMNFYFITRRQTRKYKNLMTNRKVALVVGMGDGPGTIQAEGEAQLMEDGEGIEKFFGNMKKHEGLAEAYYGPFLMLPGLDLAVFCVRVSWMRYLHLNTDTQTEEYYRVVG